MVPVPLRLARRGTSLGRMAKRYYSSQSIATVLQSDSKGLTGQKRGADVGQIYVTAPLFKSAKPRATARWPGGNVCPTSSLFEVRRHGQLSGEYRRVLYQSTPLDELRVSYHWTPPAFTRSPTVNALFPHTMKKLLMGACPQLACARWYLR